MASSPAEVLARVAAAWDRAFEAVQQHQLDRVAALLAETERLLATETTAGGDAAALRRAIERAESSRGRLSSALHHGRDEVRDELATVRRGRRVLDRYGGRAPATATRLDCET